MSRDWTVSLDYLAEMDSARALIDELVAAGFALPRIVWRARTIYREIHERELARYQEACRRG